MRIDCISKWGVLCMYTHTMNTSVSTFVSWARMTLMREPHTSAFNIGFCLHGMYVCTSDCMSRPMRPAQLVTHITCNYSHYVFCLLHVFTFEDISWEFWGGGGGKGGSTFFLQFSLCLKLLQKVKLKALDCFQLTSSLASAFILAWKV